ncbi:MAG: hypothetical protein K2V38_08265 [Gemmataceae bacterium]|nr:hypothetical protein [Gemmataceae bacterium]
MTAREKIDTAVADLQGRGVRPTTAAPPFWQLLWRAGAHVPPPHFLGFIPLTFLFGLPFALILSAGLVLPVAFGAGLHAGTVAFPLVGSGAFGLTMAGYYRWSAWRMGLPSWRKFDPTRADDEDDPTW